MAKRALYQMDERQTWALTDLAYVGTSNRDYWRTHGLLAEQYNAHIKSVYNLSPAVLNISGGDQVSVLTAHEAGGASEKENGFEINTSWTGGNGTFNHSFTTGYGFVTKDGTVLTATDLIGYGAGYLTFRLDKDNSVWIILNDIDHVFDTLIVVTSGVTATHEKKIKNSVKVKINDANLRTTNTGGTPWLKVNYTFAYAIGNQKLIGGSCKYNASFVSIDMYELIDSTHCYVILIGSGTTASGYPYSEIEGTWR